MGKINLAIQDDQPDFADADTEPPEQSTAEGTGDPADAAGLQKNALAAVLEDLHNLEGPKQLDELFKKHKLGSVSSQQHFSNEAVGEASCNDGDENQHEDGGIFELESTETGTMTDLED